MMRYRKAIRGKPESTDLPAPKAHVPSEEARRPSGQRDRLAATARVPAPEVCLPSEQVPFEETPSEQEPSDQAFSAQGPSGQVMFKVSSEEAPSALKPSANIPTAEGRDAGTLVPSAKGATELPLAEQE
ncbi:hypothetical protein AXG93_3921s1000 [Marchantia polymorpha subsp. ruderalis]|uniref:Uncharacterized protein n=1 Tax=Marchantia polymorpha subsp. ruderalis TaxID=1480154 RepID=A0A176WAH6_MARPO|nr:hypothetical protein AXG93_3921s1000 [Marchantia polymorpha subsp. ruderalis]